MGASVQSDRTLPYSSASQPAADEMKKDVSFRVSISMKMITKVTAKQRTSKQAGSVEDDVAMPMHGGIVTLRVSLTCCSML